MAYWRKGNSVFVLAKSAAAIVVPADTTEDTLVTITIPAMGPNSWLRVTTQWSWTNSANNKTPRVRFGGASGTQFLNTAFTTTVSFDSQIHIKNRNSTSSQVGNGTNTSGSYAATGSAPTTSAVETNGGTTLVITGQKASSGETMTLESYLVEVMW